MCIYVKNYDMPGVRGGEKVVEMCWDMLRFSEASVPGKEGGKVKSESL